jgi:transcription termination factor NusB
LEINLEKKLTLSKALSKSSINVPTSISIEMPKKAPYSKSFSKAKIGKNLATNHTDVPELKTEQNKKFEKPHSKPFNAKTGSRFVAVQALYSLMVDDGQTEKEALLNASELFKEKFSKRISFNFASELLEKSISEKQSIEYIFKNYLEKLKEVDLVNPLVRAIVTVALCELLINQTASKKIVISEYVKVASSFFNKKEVGFVNALLDKFVKENQ